MPISMISKRYARANNKKKSDFIDKPSELKKWITYLDANNLYGWAMMENLPMKDFQWVENPSLELLKENVDEDKCKGNIVEVDIDYPQELHDKHNCFPLAPE